MSAFAAGLFVAYAYVAAPLLEGDEPEATQPAAEGPVVVEAELPPRPASVPQRIPAWAWDLSEWHSQPAGQRDARPEGAPARVPGWYWDWRAWRLELAGSG